MQRSNPETINDEKPDNTSLLNKSFRCTDAQPIQMNTLNYPS